MLWKRLLYIGIAVLCILAFIYLFRKKSKKELLLLLTPITILLLVLEIGFRLFYPQSMEHNNMFKFDAKYGWKFKPGKNGLIIYPGEARHFIATDNRGFRTCNYWRDSSEFNVYVLGDSYVSNISVDDSAVFTYVLGQKLQKTNVWNYGVNGYGQIQELLLLKEQSRFHPDLMMVMLYTGNDFTDNIGTDWLYARPYGKIIEDSTLFIVRLDENSKQPEGAKVSVWSIFKKSHLLSFVNNRINAISESWGIAKCEEQYTPFEFTSCAKAYSDEMERTFKITELALLEMKNACEASGIPFVLVVAPSLLQADEKLWKSTFYDHKKDTELCERTIPNARLVEFAAKIKIDVIDLLPALSSRISKGETLYFAKEQHWNIAGNKVVAETIEAHISQNYPQLAKP